APAVMSARIALLLRDDLLGWGLVAGSSAIAFLLLPILLPILGVGAILALFGGLSGTPQGGGPLPGGAPSAVAVEAIPADQLAVMREVADAAPCALPWTVLASIASVESQFGNTADRVSSAGAYGYGQFLEGTWQAYGGGVPWRASDPDELSRPVDQRR